MTGHHITISQPCCECELNWTGAAGQDRGGAVKLQPRLHWHHHWHQEAASCCLATACCRCLHDVVFRVQTLYFQYIHPLLDKRYLERGNLPLSSIITITPSNELEAGGIFPSPKIWKCKQRHFLLPFNTANRKDKFWYCKPPRSSSF